MTRMGLKRGRGWGVFLGVWVELTAAAWASGQSLSLEDAVDLGRKNSPDLKRLEWEAEAAGAKRWEAISGFLPQLSAGATYFLDAKYASVGVNLGGQAASIPTAFPQTSIDLVASWTFFDGFGTWNLFHAASLGSDAAGLELGHAQFKKSRSVQIKFYQALAAQQLALVTAQNIETLENHLAFMKASEEAGTGTRVDVLRIQAELEEARAEKLLADDNVVLAKRALAEEMGVEETPETLVGNLPVPQESQVPDQLKLNLQERGDYQAQVKREQASDRLNSAAWGALLPRASIFLSEQFYGYNNTFSPLIVATQGLQNAYNIGLKLSWNLFDGGASIARKSQLDAQAQQSIQMTRKMLLHAGTEFETWKRRYHYNVLLFKARQRSVEQTEESVRLAGISVKAGTKTHSEFLDAERDLFRARAGVIQSQLAAAESLSNLELTIGRELK